MFSYFRRPHADLAAVILRLGLGFIFAAHGYIKLFQPLSWSEQISRSMQITVGWAELIFGTLLVIGLLSRLAALGIMADMIGAIVLVTGSRDFIAVEVGRHGFTFRASGFEYNVMIIVGCLAVIALGSGMLSVDHLIFGRKKEQVAVTPVEVPPSSDTPAAQPENMVSTR